MCPAPQVYRAAHTPARWRKMPRGAGSFFRVERFGYSVTVARIASPLSAIYENGRPVNWAFVLPTLGHQGGDRCRSVLVLPALRNRRGDVDRQAVGRGDSRYRAEAKEKLMG